MNFRYKFVFVTWQKDPDALNVVERARMSSDKSLIKAVMTVSVVPFMNIITINVYLFINVYACLIIRFQESAVELQIEDANDLTLENIGKAVVKTGI